MANWSLKSLNFKPLYMQNNRNLILYIAMSLDVHIGKSDGDISFLSQVEKEGEDYGYSKFMESVDNIYTNLTSSERV